MRGIIRGCSLTQAELCSLEVKKKVTHCTDPAITLVAEQSSSSFFLFFLALYKNSSKIILKEMWVSTKVSLPGTREQREVGWVFFLKGYK